MVQIPISACATGALPVPVYLVCRIIDTTCLKHRSPSKGRLAPVPPRRQYLTPPLPGKKEKRKDLFCSSFNTVPWSRRSPRKLRRYHGLDVHELVPYHQPLPCAAHSKHIIIVTAKSHPHVQSIPPQISRSSQGSEEAESRRTNRIIARAWSCEFRFGVSEVRC